MDWLEVLPPVVREIIKIGIIIGLGVFAGLGAHLAGKGVERRALSGIANQERLYRLRTLIQAGTSIVEVIIAGVVIMMILYELDINITPILASAGVAGLALSLGSQTFIRDFFGGILILVENLYTVGDVIQIGEYRGKVERITLRATYLRSLEGEMVVIPNGDIRSLRNLTTDWSRAVITLNVPRNADMERVMRILSAGIQAIQSDPEVSPHLIEAPMAEGWIDMTDAAIQVRVMAKTLPGKQWEVAQALRKYALRALAENNLSAKTASA